MRPAATMSGARRAPTGGAGEAFLTRTKGLTSIASKAFYGCPLCSLLSCGSFNTDPLGPNAWWVVLALAARVGTRAPAPLGRRNGSRTNPVRLRGYSYNSDLGYYGYNPAAPPAIDRLSSREILVRYIDINSSEAVLRTIQMSDEHASPSTLIG